MCSMNQAYNDLKTILGVRLRENEPMDRHTTLKVGGPADLFYEAKTTDELLTSIGAARNLSLPVRIVGGGSNILVGDKGIRGLVIKNATSVIAMKGMKGSLSRGMPRRRVFVAADSGVVMNQLVRFTIEEGLAGLEMQLGLPGTVGGAVFMNSKWTNPEGYVGDAVYQANILTPKGEQLIVPRSYFHFGYDQSIIQKTHDVVLRVVFALTSQPKDQLWRVANASIAYRRESQPHGVLSPGCTFRNISKAQAYAIPTPNHTTSAGFLIDHAGLKGMSVGDAEISPVHANFIINRGHATASDVVQLIERARDQVKKQFGIELVEEIVRVGEF